MDSALASILDLKARIEAEYRADLLLIDARTGITELGGIATSVLADKVVCLFLNSQESLTGTRAVMRSLGVAARLKGHAPVEQFAVLSRTSNDTPRRREEVLDFLNEDGPSSDETLSLDRLFVLHSDPDLEEEERLHLGGKVTGARTPLHRDYLFLVSSLTEAAEIDRERAWQRREAIQDLIDWLTEDYGRDDGRSPRAFDEDQVVEGMELGGQQRRYADLVAFSGDDHAEALLAAEYVEGDLEESDAWQWWERNTRLRCLILFGAKKKQGSSQRVFTRSRSATKFIERDRDSAWSVKWPLSFTALDDPGNQSIEAMLEAVQRGEEGFISLLITEWEHSVLFTIHGGAPFRPVRAKQILDGLADVRDPETEDRILWRTAPDPFEGRRRHFPEESASEEQMHRELHAPLFWRLSARAKMSQFHHRHHPRGGGRSYGLDLLAQEILGLSLDQDRALRALTTSIVRDGEKSEEVSWRIRARSTIAKLHFEFSEDVPTELIRRVFLDRMSRDEREEAGGDAWAMAESEARSAMSDDQTLSRLCRSRDGRLDIVTTNLLGRYESSKATVALYSSLIAWCARELRVDPRSLENVVLLHESIHAVCHLGVDLDGRSWDSFSLPTSENLGFRPDVLHEGIAQYFTFRMLERLDDSVLTRTFETLTSAQPPEYQRWRSMRQIPIERVREILIAARTGLGDSLSSLS